MMWILSSEEFVAESSQNRQGKNKGKRSIWFNGKRKNRETGGFYEYCKPQFEKYVAHDFGRLVNIVTNNKEQSEMPAQYSGM